MEVKHHLLLSLAENYIHFFCSLNMGNNTAIMSKSVEIMEEQLDINLPSPMSIFDNATRLIEIQQPNVTIVSQPDMILWVMAAMVWLLMAIVFMKCLPVSEYMFKTVDKTEGEREDSRDNAGNFNYTNLV